MFSPAVVSERSNVPLPFSVSVSAPVFTNTEYAPRVADLSVSGVSTRRTAPVFAPAESVIPSSVPAAFPVYANVPGPTTSFEASVANERSFTSSVPELTASPPARPERSPVNFTTPPPVRSGLTLTCVVAVSADAISFVTGATDEMTAESPSNSSPPVIVRAAERKAARRRLARKRHRLAADRRVLREHRRRCGAVHRRAAFPVAVRLPQTVARAVRPHARARRRGRIKRHDHLHLGATVLFDDAHTRNRPGRRIPVQERDRHQRREV